MALAAPLDQLTLNPRPPRRGQASAARRRATTRSASAVGTSGTHREELLDRDDQLAPAEVRAEAAVDAAPEREVAVLRRGRSGSCPGRRTPRGRGCPAPNTSTTRSPALISWPRTVVSADRCGPSPAPARACAGTPRLRPGSGRVSRSSACALGVARQVPEPGADRPRRGVETGDEQQVAVRDQLVVRQRPAVDPARRAAR